MPNFKAHCAISKQRTGYDFELLHRWVDNPPEAKFLGADHRIIRHAFTAEDMETIKKYWDLTKGHGWGDKAIIEWLFHIAIDNISTAFKLSRNCYGENTYNLITIGISTSGFINVKFDRATDFQLRKQIAR